jgi:hypothetical protein
MGSMIQSASLLEFLMMIVVPLAMAGIAVYAGLRARRRTALIKATPTVNIAMADDGYRKFEGTIEAIAGKTVFAPLTKSPCVWFHAKVEESVASRQTKTGRHWKELTDVTSSTPFLVRDATGSCVVYPDDADVTPTDRSLWYGATREPTDTHPPKVGPGESPRPSIDVLSGSDTKYRYSEERIYADNPLLVLGRFTAGVAGDDKMSIDTEDDDGEAADERVVQAAAGTKASIRRASTGPPFILSTTPQGAHVAAMDKGGKAAFVIALVMLAIAATIIWLRLS